MSDVRVWTSVAGTTDTLRRFLLAVLIVGLVGTAVELLLLGHYEGAWQLAPLVLIGLALGAIGWHLLHPGPASLRVLRSAMGGFVLASLLGLFLHYRGNLQYQLEFDPTLQGVALFWKVMHAKAPPALAPGVLAQLGVIGLIYAYRHPAADRAATTSSTTTGGTI